MASRIYRLWQPGNPRNRVFLPNFWMKLVKPNENEVLPQNFVKFEIPLEMSSHDVEEYLTKIYKLPVCEVQTKVEQGEMIRNTMYSYDYDSFTQRRMAGELGRVADKEPDKKYAYAVMEKNFKFEFPDLFPEEKTWQMEKEIKKIQKRENERAEEQEKNWHRPKETWFGL